MGIVVPFVGSDKNGPVFVGRWTTGRKSKDNRSWDYKPQLTSFPIIVELE